MAAGCAVLGTGCREGTLPGGPWPSTSGWRPRPAGPPAVSAGAASAAPAGGVRAEEEDCGARPCAPSTARWRSPAGCACGPPGRSAPAARGRGDRPGHGLRHRPAPHHPGVPGAARRAPGGRLPARRRVRIGGARDRGPAAGLRPGVGARPRPARGGGDPRQRAAQPRGPARRPAHDRGRPAARRSRRGRQPHGHGPGRLAGALPGPRRGGWWPRGCAPTRPPASSGPRRARPGARRAGIVDDGWASVLLERS